MASKQEEGLIPCIMDHDGGVDDLVALALLAARPDKIKLLGCVVIDADCFIEPAFEVSGKLLSMLAQDAVPVGKSTLSGLHPFPDEWRKDAVNMNDMPSVNIPAVLARWEANKRHATQRSGQQLMADLVLASPEPVTICVTGPLSSVAWCVSTYGDKFVSNVKEVVIMGGAVDVGGNVFTDDTDGSAEWNIYWDAPAAKVVNDCEALSKVFFSLDSTNHVPVTSSFVQRFGSVNHSLLAQFVGNSWAMCTHFSTIYGEGKGYYAWDALTAAFVLDRSLVELEEIQVVVVTGKVKNEGQTKRDSGKDGKRSLMAKNTKSAEFYDMVLSCCGNAHEMTVKK